MKIDEKRTIASIVREDYKTAQIFTAFGLDFCCGGKVSLERACEQAGLELDELLRQLEIACASETVDIDFDAFSNAQLIDHIVQHHHQYITDNVPYISQLLHKIAEVHGVRHPELAELRDLFDEATDALYDHMKKEEIILFPAIREMESARTNGRPLPPLPFGSISNPIGAMESEHDYEGNAFKQMAALTANFTPPEDGCSTYRVAFAKLEEFVNDLHQHIHLENNILFENAVKLEGALV